MSDNTARPGNRPQSGSHIELTPEREAAINERLDRLDDLLEEILVVLEKLKADGKVNR